MLPQFSSMSGPIARLHRLRLACHAFLFLFCAALLSITAVTLAFSIRSYHGSFLHATPELLTAGGLGFILLFVVWLPRGRGHYGFHFLHSVLAETLYMGMLALCFFGGVTSLHEATPGLLSSCGGFFVCNVYIASMVLAWLSWLAAATSAILLLSSALYQHFRRRRGASVWAQPLATWEWFWPDEARPSGSARRSTFVGGLDQLPRVSHHKPSDDDAEKGQSPAYAM